MAFFFKGAPNFLEAPTNGPGRQGLSQPRRPESTNPQVHQSLGLIDLGLRIFVTPHGLLRLCIGHGAWQADGSVVSLHPYTPNITTHHEDLHCCLGKLKVWGLVRQSTPNPNQGIN